MAIPPLYLFSQYPYFWKHFTDNNAPNEMPDKHKIKLMRESCFFMFRRLKNNMILFTATLLYNRQLEIWFEIITIVIKVIRNNQDLLSKKYYCCNIHTSLRESSSPPSIGNSPNMSYTPHLYKKILIPTFCDFSKISSLNR